MSVGWPPPYAAGSVDAHSVFGTTMGSLRSIGARTARADGVLPGESEAFWVTSAGPTPIPCVWSVISR
jgi:hypothetical protein